MQTISRRDFLRRSVAGAVGLGVMGLPQKSSASDTLIVPAVVIGSGFGGAVAALRLAQAGVRTIVLERGRRWPIRKDGNTFATFENPDGRCSWLSDTTPIAFIERDLGLKPATFPPYTGVMEFIQGNGITILRGAGVGGGSLAYNAILAAPHRNVFEQIFPSEIDFDQMEAIYYPKVLSVIGASTIPDDILATDFYQSTRVNLEQAQAFKQAQPDSNIRLVDMGIDWDVVREEINGTKRPSTIAGQSWYGLNSGAKQSVDHNYLAMAEARKSVRIFPLHDVVSIEEIVIGKRVFYRVSADEITKQGKFLRRRKFICQHLFLAAGSLGTTKLLLNAKAAGALSNLSDQVGQNWAANGDYVVVRVGLPPNKAGTGGPCGHFILEDYLPQNVDLNNPQVPPPNGLIELVTPPHFVAQIKDVLGLGDPSTYVGMGIHPAIGSMSYDPITDELTVNFPLDDDAFKPFLTAAQTMLTTLDASNRGTFFQPFTLLNNPTSSAHPLGGAVVGEVCDQFGRVIGHPGLYVVDGAFIPGFAGCVNPALTIAALAERSMEHIIARDIMGSRRDRDFEGSHGDRDFVRSH